MCTASYKCLSHAKAGIDKGCSAGGRMESPSLTHQVWQMSRHLLWAWMLWTQGWGSLRQQLGGLCIISGKAKFLLLLWKSPRCCPLTHGLQIFSVALASQHLSGLQVTWPLVKSSTKIISQYILFFRETNMVELLYSLRQPSSYWSINIAGLCL